MLPHARARERVVPISELVFGNLTQNWSSLESSLGVAAIAGPPCIVDRVPHVRALEEPKRDPKRLWRTGLDDGPASVRKLDPKILGCMPNSMLFRPAFHSQNQQQRDRRSQCAACRDRLPSGLAWSRQLVVERGGRPRRAAQLHDGPGVPDVASGQMARFPSNDKRDPRSPSYSMFHATVVPNARPSIAGQRTDARRP